MTGQLRTPLDYVIPLVSVGAARAAQVPGSLAAILLIWTLPFVWLGVTMSVRRARDTGITPWLVVASFLPVLNYLLLLLLALAPSKAPRAAVWRQVVAFDEIVDPPTLEFRFGLAYPRRARIEGIGAGAVRYCEFSTGAFVEPITAWDEPARLAFDVTAQPPPLQEWSPWADVYAPHVEGFFTTTRGEFRLTELPGNRRRLEGRTWSTLRMAPALYWNLVADAIIHRIHRRVLQHIRRSAEAAPVVP